MTTEQRKIIKSRIADPDGTKPHRLVEATPGANRYKPGKYVCACGETFTYVNKYHAHSAANR